MPAVPHPRPHTPPFPPIKGVERGRDGSAITNVAPGKGGVERDPQAIHAHTFPGAANNELLQNSLTLKTSALREGSCILVTVSLQR